MIHFQLVSVAGTKIDEDVYEVLVPTKDGTIALFEDHMPLISAAAPGVLSVRKKPSDSDNAMEHFALSGGVVQIDGKTVRLLSDDITSEDDVSEQVASAAQARAQELLKAADSQVALHEATRMLHHSSAQLHVARLKKRHHN